VGEEETGRRKQHDRYGLRGLIAKVNGRVIVCETGIGTKLSEKRAQQVMLREPEGLLHSLKRLGIRPDEVDAVITTHLHWTTRADSPVAMSRAGLELTFKNARHFIQRTEWDFALHPDQRRESAFVKDDFTPLADGNQVVEFWMGIPMCCQVSMFASSAGIRPGARCLCCVRASCVRGDWRPCLPDASPSRAVDHGGGYRAASGDAGEGALVRGGGEASVAAGAEP